HFLHLFLFRAPPSTVIYTLSLHDALPIFVFALWYWEIDGGGPAVRTRVHYRSVDFVFPQFQQDPNGPPQPWMPDFLDYLFLAFKDRKSTRLNSSHLVISYAVFCLKKKTKI